MIARIKIEAIQNSKVMETVIQICDVHGPRLTASPAYHETAEWCVYQLKAWGQENANLESWDGSRNAWSITSFSIEMTAPYYDRLIGYPLAWSPSTSGVISSEPMLVESDDETDFEEYRDKLNEKIILNGKLKGTSPNFEPVAERVEADELAGMKSALNTAAPNVFKKRECEYIKKMRKRNQFYLEEGVAAVKRPSGKDHAITVAMSANPSRDPDSTGYVKKHLGDPETLELLPEHEKLSASLNLDNGCGKIRSIYLQRNEFARPIFKQLLEPFDYLNANTISRKSTSGTDHIPFSWIGLPAFQFIQDPMEYSNTWHTNLDVVEALLPYDLKQNVAIDASLVYHLAMRDESMPREDMPKLPQNEDDE